MKLFKNNMMKWAIALAILQVLDGVLTAWGVSNFGPDVEGNPLVKLLIERFGSEHALFVIKLIGVLISFLFVWVKADKILIFITGLYAGIVLIWIRFWLSTLGG